MPADAKKPAPSAHPNNPLHGVTLQMMLERLVQDLGWPRMGKAVAIRCFMFEPTITSSLRFLRRTPWARAEVEALYLKTVKGKERGAKPA
jgi:uncharacterized protein (DUF2132 family)